MRSEFSLNNLTENVSVMIAPPHDHASNGFKTDSASFLPHSFFLLLRPVVHEDAIENTNLLRMFFFRFNRLCVCVCVFFPSILDIKFVGRTSRGHTGGRSHRIFNPPSFCGACLDFCREKDSAIPFPRRP